MGRAIGLLPMLGLELLGYLSKQLTRSSILKEDPL